MPPSEVADRLASGDLDVGLVPSIELQRIPSLQLVPGLCVAATREVRSVLLVLATAVEKIERVALDINSRTSAALVEILLRDRYGLQPKTFRMAPDVDAMLSEAEAALVIGDPALKVDRSRHRVLDLAAEWRELVGLPFVFAVWAVRETVEAPGLTECLQASLRSGLDHLEEIVEVASRDLALEREAIRRYLTEHLSYSLGREELAGLEEFHRRAYAHGLIPSHRHLAVYDSLPRQA